MVMQSVYTIGKDIKGLEYRDLDIIEKENYIDKEGMISEEVGVFILSEETDIKRMYKILRIMLENKDKRIILIDTSEKEEHNNILKMLMVSYKAYDIYENSFENVSMEYISSIIDRKPGREEVITFIDPTMEAYSEATIVILELLEAVRERNIDNLIDVVESNIEIIQNSLQLIENLKIIVERLYDVESNIENKNRHEAKIDTESMEELEKLKNRIKELERHEEEKKEAIDLLGVLREENTTLREEMVEKDRTMGILAESEKINKDKVQELQDSLNKSEGVIKTYLEINTRNIAGCKTKIIVYFKEIAPIPFISSTIKNFVEVIRMTRKINVRLLIYDNVSSFLASYQPIPVINSREYVSNKNTVVNILSSMVIIEPNQAILESILKSSNAEIVVIYDRLKVDKDIVVGNIVFKYWILNSRREYSLFEKSQKIQKERIITRPGVFPESLAISEIKEYGERTESGKLMAYADMMNTGIKKGRVFESIYDTTNISTLWSKG